MREDKKPWYIRHMFLFAELEDTIKCVPPSGEFKFLDLGYATFYLMTIYCLSLICAVSNRADVALGDSQVTSSAKTAELGASASHSHLSKEALHSN